MSDQLKRSLSGAVAAATPEAPPPYAQVLARRDQRRRRTRGAVAVGAVAAATATVVLVSSLGAPGQDESAPPIATDGTTTPPATPGATLEPAPLTGDSPPPLVLAGPRGPIEAAQGSSCWGNGCFDSVRPAAMDVPSVGDTSPLEVAFPVVGQWGVTLGGLDGSYGCATYPALVEPIDDTHLRLTPSGPGGPRLASYFVRAGGDTSGYWRWTVPERDGRPLAWVSLAQNSPSSGGEARLKVVVDDAAVDGDVAATVTVEAADGTRTEIEPTRVDQHCRGGDGFVEIATGYDYPQGRIDGLGPAPYAYTVDLTIDGRSYTGTGTWSGEHTEHGGDARLAFEPTLPPLG